MTVGFYLGFLLLHRVSKHCGSGFFEDSRTVSAKVFQNFSNIRRFELRGPKTLNPYSPSQHIALIFQFML